MSPDHAAQSPRATTNVETVRVTDLIAVALRMHNTGLVQVCRSSGTNQKEETR